MRNKPLSGATLRSGFLVLFLNCLVVSSPAHCQSITVPNFSFEIPSTSTFVVDPPGNSWTFANGGGHSAGVARNSEVGVGSAPAGNQVGFIQSTSSISQRLSGFVAGATYAVTVAAAQRPAVSVGSFNIEIDGNSIGSFTPTGTSYSDYTATFTASNSSHTLGFYGTVSSDTEINLDDVTVTAVPASVGTLTANNFGFETPVTSSFVFDPGGAGVDWTFTDGGGGRAGIAANGSAVLSANPSGAPQGNQVAFLQATSSVTQSVSGFIPGVSYAVTVSAAERAGHTGESFDITVDGQVVGSYSPLSAATTFTDYSATFVATNPSQRLGFAGTGASRDCNILLDNVRIVPIVPLSVADMGFETPRTTNYSTDPSGSPWMFTNGSVGQCGIAKNGSGVTYANPDAPEGVQVAWLQGTSSISQPIHGLVPSGQYLIIVSASERSGHGHEPFGITVDGVPIISVPASFVTTAYVDFGAVFTAGSASTHTIGFTGTGASTDNCVLLDNVRIMPAVGPTTPTGLTDTPGMQELALFWSPVGTASSYNIYRSTTPGGEGTTPYVAGVQAASFNDSGLVSGTTYYYKVSAVNAVGTSALSDEVSGQPLPTTSVGTVAQSCLMRSENVGGDDVSGSETVLNTANVNSNDFGKIMTLPVTGYIFPQILVANHISIGGGFHNVAYVATEHNMLYAYDADTGVLYWNVSLGEPLPLSMEHDHSVPIEEGILSTPCIDLTAGRIYVCCVTSDGVHVRSVAWKLHSLSLSTGAEEPGSPVSISGTVPGTSPDSGNGKTVTFDPDWEANRASLVEANGNIYIAFASHGDLSPYHGWVFAYNASTLAQTAIFNDSPNGCWCGIWMTGQHPLADSKGNIYVMTGNARGSETSAGTYGEAIVKLSPNLAVLDYFKCYDAVDMDLGDSDLGSGGPFMITGTDYVAGGGKPGDLFVVDENNMGGYNTSTNNVHQWFGLGSEVIYCTPLFYNSAMYTWSPTASVEKFDWNGSAFATTPSVTSNGTDSYELDQIGVNLGASTNNGAPGTGIIWAVAPTVFPSGYVVDPAILYAFDANNLNLLYESDTVAGDDVGDYAKYNPPTIANGKVYIATHSQEAVVYGLRSSAPGIQ